MSMTKYSTYEIFKNKKTNEIKRIPLGNQEELEKTASLEDWEQLKEDPEVEELEDDKTE